MNKLYSLLVDGVQIPSSSFYYKKKGRVVHNRKSLELLRAIVTGVDKDRIPAFACHVCSLVLSTCFGDEINELDPDNTYFGLARDPLIPLESGQQLSDLADPGLLPRISPLLDTDIRDRLELPLWHDVVAAGCLQMLRELDNA